MSRDEQMEKGLRAVQQGTQFVHLTLRSAVPLLTVTGHDVAAGAAQSGIVILEAVDNAAGRLAQKYSVRAELANQRERDSQARDPLPPTRTEPTAASERDTTSDRPPATRPSTPDRPRNNRPER